jgi:hypothetical protein
MRRRVRQCRLATGATRQPGWRRLTSHAAKMSEIAIRMNGRKIQNRIIQRNEYQGRFGL